MLAWAVKLPSSCLWLTQSVSLSVSQSVTSHSLFIASWHFPNPSANLYPRGALAAGVLLEPGSSASVHPEKIELWSCGKLPANYLSPGSEERAKHKLGMSSISWMIPSPGLVARSVDHLGTAPVLPASPVYLVYKGSLQQLRDMVSSHTPFCGPVFELIIQTLSVSDSCSLVSFTTSADGGRGDTHRVWERERCERKTYRGAETEMERDGEGG